jgi:16S rRNA (cytidine1402-2'-O)-methyltransferase
MSGKIFIIPTPIGNLGDITLRSLETLKTVDTILAEDTRVTVKLLRHFEVTTNCKSYHQHNEHRILNSIIDELKSGVTMGLVTDAGTPGISDPGFLLIRECIKNGIEVETLPGATALIPAIVNSGIPCDRFLFEGFLPQKKGRETKLKELAQEKRTIVFYESPYRVIKTFQQLIIFLGKERLASYSREISKLHEETKRGTLDEILNHLEQKPSIKGEFVITIQGID